VLELVGPHAPVARSDAGEPTRWVSAGGFEELFASYGLPVHLV
jgi:hypothetical protein